MTLELMAYEKYGLFLKQGKKQVWTAIKDGTVLFYDTTKVINFPAKILN